MLTSHDPFLHSVHHRDAYPRGDERMAPVASLAGRDLGNDFAGKDGWNMYHGEVVPGFPRHPHRGFETITIVRSGYIDHFDSLGAMARYGPGDVQWLTAGKGIVHSEMFPLIEQDKPNPLELFQIWLNLPQANKLVEPHFTMFWRESLPRLEVEGTQITIIAGWLGGVTPLPPPPHSYAAQLDSDVAIWSIKMAPGAKWKLPRAASEETTRTLHVFRGDGVAMGGQAVEGNSTVQLLADADVPLANGPVETEILLLQGRPLGEPVAQHGPFVMNTTAELQRAFNEYQRTQFGGWSWPSDGPVHARGEGRFARLPDGKILRP